MGCRSIAPLFPALHAGGWSTSRPGRFTPWKQTGDPLYSRLGGSRAVLDECEKSRPPPRFDPRTVQPVASRYTDCSVTWIHHCMSVPTIHTPNALMFIGLPIFSRWKQNNSSGCYLNVSANSLTLTNAVHTISELWLFILLVTSCIPAVDWFVLPFHVCTK
jgi:hypothetical protein